MTSELPREHEPTSNAQPAPVPWGTPSAEPSSAELAAQATNGAAPPKVNNVLSTTRRTGAWELPAESAYSSVLGSINLDLRQARLLSHTTTIRFNLAMASARLRVPPGIRVELALDDLASSSKLKRRTRVPVDPEGPVLRLTGTSILSSVTVIQK